MLLVIKIEELLYKYIEMLELPFVPASAAFPPPPPLPVSLTLYQINLIVRVYTVVFTLSKVKK